MTQYFGDRFCEFTRNLQAHPVQMRKVWPSIASSWSTNVIQIVPVSTIISIPVPSILFTIYYRVWSMLALASLISDLLGA